MGTRIFTSLPDRSWYFLCCTVWSDYLLFHGSQSDLSEVLSVADYPAEKYIPNLLLNTAYGTDGFDRPDLAGVFSL